MTGKWRRCVTTVRTTGRRGARQGVTAAPPRHPAPHSACTSALQRRRSSGAAPADDAAAGTGPTAPETGVAAGGCGTGGASAAVSPAPPTPTRCTSSCLRQRTSAPRRRWPKKTASRPGKAWQTERQKQRGCVGQKVVLMFSKHISSLNLLSSNNIPSVCAAVTKTWTVLQPRRTGRGAGCRWRSGCCRSVRWRPWSMSEVRRVRGNGAAALPVPAFVVFGVGSCLVWGGGHICVRFFSGWRVCTAAWVVYGAETPVAAAVWGRRCTVLRRARGNGEEGRGLCLHACMRALTVCRQQQSWRGEV